jgi:hypothetical protein
MITATRIRSSPRAGGGYGRIQRVEQLAQLHGAQPGAAAGRQRRANQVGEKLRRIEPDFGRLVEEKRGRQHARSRVRVIQNISRCQLSCLSSDKPMNPSNAHTPGSRTCGTSPRRPRGFAGFLLGQVNGGDFAGQAGQVLRAVVEHFLALHNLRGGRARGWPCWSSTTMQLKTRGRPRSFPPAPGFRRRCWSGALPRQFPAAR